MMTRSWTSSSKSKSCLDGSNSCLGRSFYLFVGPFKAPDFANVARMAFLMRQIESPLYHDLLGACHRPLLGCHRLFWMVAAMTAFNIRHRTRFSPMHPIIWNRHHSKPKLVIHHGLLQIRSLEGKDEHSCCHCFVDVSYVIFIDALSGMISCIAMSLKEWRKKKNITHRMPHRFLTPFSSPPPLSIFIFAL